MSYDGYLALASVYDKLNEEIDYSKWADFFERCFERYCEKKPEIVLDLACGTGRMTAEMAKRGYDMIGVDGSADMLSEAYAKADESEDTEKTGRILYLLQDMRSFELYGTVGAVVCCLDSINYLLSDEDVKKTLWGVHNYLDPDGLFLFDVHTPYKFENVYGNNAYVLEGERPDDGGAIFCGWQNEYDRESGICDFYLSIFEQMGEDETYSRSDEHQRERCYSLDALKRLLCEARLEFLGVFSDFEFSEPAEKTERWYIAARAKK